MDIFDDYILDLWKALEEFKVRYILVGGYAVTLHGYQRFTGDMDIWLDDTPSNRKALRKAFSKCDMGDYPMIETMQFVPGWTDFHLNNGFTVDILIGMKGLEGFTFTESLEMASIADIEGTPVPFLHIDQLIENKKTVNRLKDQLDVQMLEELKKLRN
ncbi:hypothetical protein [Mucilaginibacter pedocola]|uniref:Nucleotidyltransferase n=1 Tax=Mucilaginibacter pedocola TaxID=1792845 RepID=A0A1S9PMK4_9SPHI|nr:hypothetical protein [Mucilaginibacter pedocola]OOQ62170.1 hypothetical protein BC343_03740 [Mucilaginibacter pedocola]